MPAFDNVAPLGIGVVGLGRAGMFHIERLSLRSDCRLIAAHDDCPQTARKAVGMVPRLVDSRTEVLRDKAVELVLLATPPDTHAALAVEALSAGKHVLVETPLCLDVAEVEAVLSAARRYDRSVIVAQTRRWESDFLTARQCLESGVLGRLLTVKQIIWQYNRSLRHPPGRTADSAASAPGPSPSHNWRRHSVTGGGALWEFGVHQFDQLLQLVGESPANVVAEYFPVDDVSDADDGYLALVHFPGGVRAHLEVNRASPVALQTGWILVGTAASYVDGMLLTVARDGEVVDQPLPPVEGAVDELYAAVVGHIRGRAPNPVPVEEARQTVLLIQAARQAARSSQPIRLDN